MLTKVGPPKDYYQEQGYYIFKKLIPDDLIDNLIEEYKSRIVSSKAPFYRQSTRWQSNKISPHGYVVSPFMDTHCYDHPNQSIHGIFSEAVRRILCAQEVREALNQLTGSQQHNLVQSMLFDLNSATPPHQDWYYLDSIPNGHLIAGWFALEDIHEEAGRFYVLPKSHTVNFDLTDDEKKMNSRYVKTVRRYVDSHQSDIYAPYLQKGDVLFWNSRTIHGSLKTLDPQYSRKSLTGHYLPSQYQFGNLYAKSPKVVEYAKHESMNYRLVHRSNSPYKDEFEEQMEWHLVKEAISSGDEKAMGQNWRLRWGPKIYRVARRIKNLLNSKS
jgi:phytanoyl-CoA hydroxylase